MPNEFSKQEIIDLINSKINDSNLRFPGLISEELRERALSNYISSDKTISQIESEISSIISKMEHQHIEQQNQINGVELNPNEIDTGLKTNHQGIYLSSLMITALSLINCSNIEEINNWIDSVPNLYMISPLQDGNYSPEQIDAVKRKLFEIYQDSMTCTQVVNDINSNNKEDAMRYALHKKLIGLNLSIEDEIKLGNIGLSKGLPVLYKEVEKICINKYGEEKGMKISSKIVYYFTTDYENFNSSTYEQMMALNEQIKQNVAKCNSMGGDFQLVLRSIGYGNTVSDKINQDGRITYDYNYDVSSMGQNLSEKLGASYRLRSMINRNAAEEMVAKGFTKSDKELVIKILRDSLTFSLESFNSSIKDDGNKRSFELFNELVEIKKPDKDFKCVWEEKFGITLEDVVRQVIIPNSQLIKNLKEKNVDFMYNETMLQEAPEKRAKVMETMLELQKLAPGLITVFGDQDHTFSSDYTPEGIEQLKATAEFDKQMSEIVVGRRNDGSIIRLKLECSERDLYMSKEEISSLEKKGMSKTDILKYKQSLEKKHAEIFKKVPFERECEWTVVDNISGDYFKEKQITKDTYIGKYTKISELSRKDNSQMINKDMIDYNNWKTKVEEQKKESTKQENVSQIKTTRGPEIKSASFTKRSESEVQIAEHIKAKNMAIKKQKEEQRSLNKPKVKTLTKSPNNNSSSSSGGFVDTLVITLITGFIAGALFMVVYSIIK